MEQSVDLRALATRIDLDTHWSLCFPRGVIPRACNIETRTTWTQDRFIHTHVYIHAHREGEREGTHRDTSMETEDSRWLPLLVCLFATISLCTHFAMICSLKEHGLQPDLIASYSSLKIQCLGVDFSMLSPTLCCALPGTSSLFQSLVTASLVQLT